MSNRLAKYAGFFGIMVFSAMGQSEQFVRVATFNVSMEATNYEKPGTSDLPLADALPRALAKNSEQIKNIAEIIQTVAPDIILLNEFDNTSNSHNKDHVNITSFLHNYLNRDQNQQLAQLYPYIYQGASNTGVPSGFDLNNDGKVNQLPQDGFGFGFFPGHYAMVLLSKYPIQQEQIRTFQQFKWKDMPNALKPVDPNTGKAWYSEQAWKEFRLSSKSHWDIPITVNGKTLHILASHPTPPVFDGPEDRNGRRNHDEIRFWTDYITKDAANYIYDDKGQYGGLTADVPFVLLGDLNATVSGGNANPEGIGSLLNHPNVNDTKPASIGALKHSPDNADGKYHTAHWRMRADYVLPSKKGISVINSGVFWPETNAETYRLIESRSASSDHRLVWVDLTLN